MSAQRFTYSHETQQMKGYIAQPENKDTPSPVILIVHDWSGCNDFVRNKAEKLAALGYIGFAIDMYGEGKTGNTKEEKAALMQPLINDRKLLLQRLLAAVSAAKKLETADKTKLAVMGFCFGGLCALDLARQSNEIAAAVSFHGLLSAPSHLKTSPVKAKILVLHGHDDPMVPPDQVSAFENEMKAAGADWQLVIYGNTVHAFTNPEAKDPGFGTVYNPLTDKRAFQAMQNFFAEVFD